MGSSKISVSEVSRVFGAPEKGFRALDRLSLEVNAGEFFCIVGPSGCGKSTLLRMLGELDVPTRGVISMTHDDRSRPFSAMIFQQESVFPWMTVAQNAAYGVRTTGQWRGAASEERVNHFLEKTGLGRFRNFYPGQLSGGMKQRLAIARAFATHSEVLLMDEPFAALDEQNKQLMQAELSRLWEEVRSTVVFITHGLEEAVLLGDRVAVMSSAPGRIIHEVKVPFNRPRNYSELKRDPVFNTLTGELWQALRDEVLAAQKREENERADRGSFRKASA